MDTFYDNDAGHFVLRVHYPDGTRHVEQFQSLAHFRQGIETAEQRLLADRWAQDGEPLFVPDGFPKHRIN